MQITVNNTVVKIKTLPFSNKFKATNIKVVQFNGVDEIELYAHCTANSLEPGRIYYCAYSFEGDLLACNTVN